MLRRGCLMLLVTVNSGCLSTRYDFCAELVGTWDLIGMTNDGTTMNYAPCEVQIGTNGSFRTITGVAPYFKAHDGRMLLLDKPKLLQIGAGWGGHVRINPLSDRRGHTEDCALVGCYSMGSGDQQLVLAVKEAGAFVDPPADMTAAGKDAGCFVLTLRRRN